jgi:hypothetical protein
VRLLALIHKEWRDSRPMTIGCALVVIALSIAANEAHFHYRDALATTRVLIPSLLLVYLLGLSSGLVATDVATRRIESMALLPARPFTLWLAKALLLPIAGGLFLAWVILLQFALHTIARGPGQIDALLRLLREPEELIPIALVFSISGVVLFFSTLLMRGFTALLAGLLVVISLGYAIEVHLGPWRAVDLGPWIGLVFLTGSAVAFTIGRVHERARARRVVAGILTVLILLSVAALLVVGGTRMCEICGLDGRSSASEARR